MSDNTKLTLEDKIADLERLLALKKAYASVSFSFPKNSKLPDDVQQQVISELQAACAQLAENMEFSKSVPQDISLTREDFVILKQLINTVKNRTISGSTASSEPSTTNQLKENDPELKNNEVRRAQILTLENVRKELRSKIDSNSLVYVRRVEDGRALVTAQSGVTFHVPVDDLDFNLE